MVFGKLTTRLTKAFPTGLESSTPTARNMNTLAILYRVLVAGVYNLVSSNTNDSRTDVDQHQEVETNVIRLSVNL